jgi:hypothetical protein
VLIKRLPFTPSAYRRAAKLALDQLLRAFAESGADAVSKYRRVQRAGTVFSGVQETRYVASSGP